MAKPREPNGGDDRIPPGGSIPRPPAPPRPQPQPPTRPSPRPQHPVPTPRPPVFDPPRPTPTRPGGGPVVSDPGGPLSAMDVLPDYFRSGLLGLIDGDNGIINGLQAGIRTGIADHPLNQAARDMVAVRSRIAGLLRSTVFIGGRDHLLGVDDEPGAIGWMAKREFELARRHLDAIDKAKPSSTAVPVTQAMLQKALSTQTIEYFRFRDDPNEPDVIVGRLRLPGYAGPTLNATHLIFLPRICQLVGGGAERDLRLPLLRAECLRGLRDFKGALTLYEQVMATASVDKKNRQFVALRAAMAHLARGDLVYRSLTRLSSTKRTEARGHYNAATAVLAKHKVPSNDPLARELRARADLQRAKLDAGLNALGLRDSFVPVQRYSALKSHADTQIRLAVDTAKDFTEALDKAETQIGQLFELQAETDAEKITNDMVDLQQDNATLAKTKIDTQISHLQSQQSFLSPEMLSASFGLVVGAVQASSGGPLGAVGMAGNVANFVAQRNELAHQIRMAEIERDIAVNQIKISELQQTMSDQRLAYLAQKQQFLTGKRLNADFLYALAEARERRAQQQLEAGILLAYLTERALAFFLGSPNLSDIRFNYADSRLGIFDAAGDLQSAFVSMFTKAESNPELAKSGSFEAALSLRENYPLQFARFLQDGHMDFVYSLYQLSKERPATHQCRIYELAVEVKGLIPTAGFTGTLVHDGRFLVRDRVSSLLDTTVRLVPTDQELEAALKRQREQGTAVAAVGGVLYYALDSDTKDLSQDTQLIPPPPQDFTLQAFEGHSPTGLWRLDIDNHERLDITDVVVHFGIINRESDVDDLAPRVRQLVRDYEAELQPEGLDRLDAFSLRQQFPDVFFALENGQATLVLDEDTFDPARTSLRFKWVALQALDQDNRGVPDIRVTIGRNEFGFTRDRVTRADGFSEDLEVPPDVLAVDQRFPLLGQWQLRLPQPGQFSQLGDLRVFIMYSYEET